MSKWKAMMIVFVSKLSTVYLLYGRLILEQYLSRWRIEEIGKLQRKQVEQQTVEWVKVLHGFSTSPTCTKACRDQGAEGSKSL